MELAILQVSLLLICFLFSEDAFDIFKDFTPLAKNACCYAIKNEYLYTECVLWNSMVFFFCAENIERNAEHWEKMLNNKWDRCWITRWGWRLTLSPSVSIWRLNSRQSGLHQSGALPIGRRPQSGAVPLDLPASVGHLSSRFPCLNLSHFVCVCLPQSYLIRIVKSSPCYNDPG